MVDLCVIITFLFYKLQRNNKLLEWCFNKHLKKHFLFKVLTLSENWVDINQVKKLYLKKKKVIIIN